MIEVEFTWDGYLRLSAEIAARYFPEDVLVPLAKGKELWLLPIRGAAAGGLLLKQRNLHGDRSVVIWEALADIQSVEDRPVGIRTAIWDDNNGALRVALVEMKDER